MRGDLSGQEVLDVGAWHGYYSFPAEQRGAQVTATDLPLSQRGKAAFAMANAISGARARYQSMDVHDIESPGRPFATVL